MAKTKEELRGGMIISRRYEEVDGIRLQSLTELEKVMLEALWSRQFQKAKEVPLTHRRSLLVRAIVDDKGERVFADNEVDMMADWDSSLIAKLNDVARILSGFEAGNVETYLKNFEAPTAGE